MLELFSKRTKSSPELFSWFKSAKNTTNPSISTLTTAGNHKVGFEDVLFILRKYMKKTPSALHVSRDDPIFWLINTLPPNCQEYVIPHTIPCHMEEKLINDREKRRLEELQRMEELNAKKTPQEKEKEEKEDLEKEEKEEKEEKQDLEKDYCFVVKKVKKDNITPNNIGEILLSQIPGISSVSAIAIMAKFKTLPNLIIQLKENESCLQNITYINSKNQTRKINKTIVTNIIKFLKS